MKIKVVSDLHLEFEDYTIDTEGVDMVILAGDIHVGINGILWAKYNIHDIPVLYVLGNHEYYKHAYPKLINTMREKSSGTNIHILENDTYDVDNIRFHGTTLWTDFNLFGDSRLAGMECEERMNDYHLIRRSPSYSKLRSVDTYQVHLSSKKWLEESLQSSKAGKNIVITHHAPSVQSVPLKYRTQLISSGFASNLEDFITKHQPDVWIHGHLHTPNDYLINKTRIISNTRGYPTESDTGFKEDFVLEI